MNYGLENAKGILEHVGSVEKYIKYITFSKYI